MKKFAKILSCVLSIVMLFSVTACGDRECSHSYTSSITKEATCDESGVRYVWRRTLHARNTK